MFQFVSRLFRSLTAELGRCMRCMRTAFLCAAGAWLASGLATTLLAPQFAIAAWSVAAVMTALWVAHAWMFTRRSHRATAVRAAGGTLVEQQAALWPRRRVLAAFIRILIFSATLNMLPRDARAQSCNCYNDNDCYCPPDFPNCVFNPSNGEAICCGPENVGCAGPSLTWCCPPGSNCYGTEGECYTG